MAKKINVNTSPSLTFAKLHMNGDVIDADKGLFNEENVKQIITGVGLTVSEGCEAPIVAGAAGSDIDSLFIQNQGFTASGDNEVTLDFKGPSAIQRTIKITSGTEVNLVEVARGQTGDLGINSTTYLLEKGAKLKLVKIQILDKDSIYIDDLRAKLDEESSLEVVRIDLGAASSYVASCVHLEGRNSDYKAHGDYLLNGSQRLDINMIAEHISPNTKSDMRYDGVLIDGACKIFRGTLDFKSGCKGAKGAENEEVILLSEDVVNRSLPIILCGEEDVEGNHGASVGKISDDILYYLASRGFDEASATRMLIRSKFNNSVSLIKNDELRREVEQQIDEVLA